MILILPSPPDIGDEAVAPEPGKKETSLGIQHSLHIRLV